MTNPVCNECGSDEGVYAVKHFYWDDKKHVWHIEHFYSEFHCGVCCNENVELSEQYLKAEVQV